MDYNQTTYAANETTVPFESAEEAWFWFVPSYMARVDGAKFTAGAGMMQRPCEPLDILKVVDRLHRNRRLVMEHIRVLKYYGERMIPPDLYRANEARAAVLWYEAMERIEEVLVSKGIVERPSQPGPNWVQEAYVYS